MRLAAAASVPIATASAVALLAIAGCGAQSTAARERAAAQAAAKAAAAARQLAEARAPKGASPTLRAIYAQFPPPRPNPQVKGSAAAIRAGERACAAKTPLAVKERFYPAAARHLSPEQRKLIAHLPSYEKHASNNASFAAGQLAADVYEATLPARIGQPGYEGCVYSLALRLERQLAPRR